MKQDCSYDGFNHTELWKRVHFAASIIHQPIKYHMTRSSYIHFYSFKKLNS